LFPLGSTLVSARQHPCFRAAAPLFPLGSTLVSARQHPCFRSAAPLFPRGSTLVSRAFRSALERHAAFVAAVRYYHFWEHRASRGPYAHLLPPLGSIEPLAVLLSHSALRSVAAVIRRYVLLSVYCPSRACFPFRRYFSLFFVPLRTGASGDQRVQGRLEPA
jgi:hypothetical protein